MHSALGYQSPAQHKKQFNRLGYVPQVHCPKNPGRSNLTPFFEIPKHTGA